MAVVDWRRNLAALAVANGITQFGVNLAQPFIPLFLDRDLDVRSPGAIAFWVGLSGSATGLSLVVLSPFWGRLADRTGRKQLALRATGLGGVFLALISLSQTPLELVGVRFLQGTVAGNISAIQSLAAAETPPARVGQALGVVGASTAIGRAIAPVIAGAAAAQVSLRVLFGAAGVVMLLATVPLVWLVRETDRRREASRRLSLRQLMAEVPASTVRTIALLTIAQGLVSTLTFTALQFIGLRVLAIAGPAAPLLTGITFGVMGIATAVGALGSGGASTAFGYRTTALVTAGLTTLVVGAMALTSTPVAFTVEAGGFGLLGGCCLPVVSSMLGLETPEPIRATAYGVANSVVGIGLVVLPAMSGLIGSRFSSGAALAPVAGAAVAACILVFLTREPNLEPVS